MLPTSAASGLGNHLDNVTTGVWNGYDNMAVEDFSTWGIVLGLLCIFIISVALRWFLGSTVNISPAVHFGLRRSRDVMAAHGERSLLCRECMHREFVGICVLLATTNVI